MIYIEHIQLLLSSTLGTEVLKDNKIGNILSMSSMQTCNSVTFYFMKKLCKTFGKGVGAPLGRGGGHQKLTQLQRGGGWY